MANKPDFVIPPNIKEKMLSVESAVEYISDSLRSEKSFMFSRFGNIEGEVVAEILLRGNRQPTQHLRSKARNNAGIAKPDNPTLYKFSVEYMASICRADLLGIWNFPDQIRLAQYSHNKHYCHMNYLDPVFTWAHKKIAWTTALKGKKVLLIHPFSCSIEYQYQRRSSINFICEMLPDFSLQTLKPPQTTQRTNEVEFSWWEQLEMFKKQILELDFDIAIIGAGAYGAPLAAFIKQLGLKALHLGGSTQLMFGIIGARWESRGYMKSIIANGWKRPFEEEKHSNSNLIEGGCYW
ncbi:hypothetical protein [Salinimonas sediminis]|uniref:Uncharacterized protein n=1 Tax=Salinimonas sediminis TaxID=2303538 RepID=A0A346NQP1_9ALTE|nr:hypothetical protein [Salinimonas sediminis]AXR07848.1 hypothetical protein D0Y50_16680 [Salinimonas sediminis]